MPDGSSGLAPHTVPVGGMALPGSRGAPRTRAPRDLRLDVLRGLCLVTIFINHVPGNDFEAFTTRNFGFSDAAEAFVMISGIAAGLAYSADFRAPMKLWQGLTRIWKRCWTLYLVQMLVTVAALAAAALAVRATGDMRILFENQMGWLWHHPLETLIALPLLLHQFDYLNILPLYILLLLASPLALIGAWRAPWLTFGLSVAIWAGFGIAMIAPQLWPMSGNWFFNPFSWQVIFVTGLLIGVASKDGRRFVPVRLSLQILAGGYLLFALVTCLWLDFSRGVGSTLWFLKDKVGVPWLFTDFDKSFLTAPRLLHILALTYLLSSLAVVRRICASRLLHPLAVLGRHALPVFAFGSIMAIGLQGLRHSTERDILLDGLLIGSGLALQFAFAFAREHWPKPAR
ncbi:OpgC family protein [Neotabrizicola shimadae]|nr:OpgC domain-containing protein [Neotabrizicola shimadae]